MKIVVCVKQVPDSAAKVVAENGEVTWGDAPLVINPWDEYAVETALKLMEEHGGDVTVISVGDESSKDALKHALAMGCNQAILISDPALGDPDSLSVAKILASTVKKVDAVDLVVFGRQAIDDDMSVTHSMTARILDMPILSYVSKIRSVDTGNQMVVEKSTEEGRQVVETNLPAVMSVIKDIGDPRYPSFMGIRKAARAQIPEWTFADLGIEAPENTASLLDITNPPAREIETEMISGDSPEEIAETLAEKIMGEKVL